MGGGGGCSEGGKGSFCTRARLSKRKKRSKLSASVRHSAGVEVAGHSFSEVCREKKVDPL